MKSVFVRMICWMSLFTSVSAFGNHVGGFISYNYIGIDTYLVKLTLYNECDGPALTDSAIVCLSSAAGNISFPTVLHLSGTPVELPPFPYFPAVITSCNGGNLTGFTKFIYEGVIVLPGQYADWIVSTSSDNMLSSGPAFTNYRPWVYTRIDNLNYPANSSVTFTNDPVFFFCINQPAWASYAATDADGDSIVYSFGNLLTDTAICPASPSLSTASFSQPVTSSTPYIIDSNAGWIHFSPMLIEVGSVCVKASEFRSQVLFNETTFMQNMIATNGCVISDINDHEGSDEIRIIYNSGLCRLQMDSKISSGSLSLVVYDATGRIIINATNKVGHSESEISVQSLPSGIYFVTGNLSTDDRLLNLKPLKFVKQ